MYIVKTDYRGRMSTELLDQIINTLGGEDVQTLTDASKAAVDIITSYSSSLYTLTAEFAKTGADRNYQVLTWAINIALYLLYQKISDYDVPAKVIKNYDDTIHDLQKLSMGKIKVNLPPIVGDNTVENGADGAGIGLRRIGSTEPRSHNI